VEVNFNDVKWRFAERVKRLVGKGRTQEEAEQTVKTVILTKEITQVLGETTINDVGKNDMALDGYTS
jgi:hypothetical protein